jgi:hypothetical protein
MSAASIFFRMGKQDALPALTGTESLRRANMIYAINYDLKRPGQNYESLYGAIKGCGAWWHYLGSTWLVDTSLTANAIWERIQPHVDGNDRFLINGITSDYSGWLPKDAWEWINSRLSRLAA